MERLNALRQEFEKTNRELEFPINFQDLDQLRERRDTIRREAQELAKKLNLLGPFWFNSAP